LTANSGYDGIQGFPVSDAPAKFTLRFRSHRTHDMLGVVADELGVSKNQLAEQMLERELRAAALLIERDLSDTMQRLRAYNRDAHLQDDIRAFAEGEAFGADPLGSRSRGPVGAEGDAFGIGDAFSR
jgi:hypothetical protein